MDLNWNHVAMWNIVAAAFIIIGLIYKQDLLIMIGFLGELVQSLSIALWTIGKILPDEKPEVNTNEPDE